jgi:futalosine hydrolase
VSVVVLAATAGEVERLRSEWARFQPSTSEHVDIVLSGIGPVNAAHALTHRLMTAPRPSLVIQTGVAGAYVGAQLEVGTVALASEEIYADLGVLTLDGWKSVEEIGIPLVDAIGDRPARFNAFPMDPGLVRGAEAACEGILARTGKFLTLSQVTGVRTLGDALHARFGALCESMEGAAAAHVCALHEVPFLEVRGISNLVEDRDRSSWRVRDAAEGAQAAARRLVEHASSLLARGRHQVERR